MSLKLYLSIAVLLQTGHSKRSREPKLLSIFQVVRFNNDACNATGTRSGTCYTPDECQTKGGYNSGACAGGFGVCCTFSSGCGDTTTENCTYFESTGTATSPGSSCALKVCKCDTNICQLRLDFEMFTITGPSTDTNPVGSAIGGQPSNLIAAKKIGAVFKNADYGRPISHVTRCATDTFRIGTPGGTAPPTVCGTLTGEHMYVQACDACNDLKFNFGRDGIGSTVATRVWSIKVTQYSCDYENLAPTGCLQYYFGPNTGTLKSFNFDNGVHLANQRQSMCIRREQGSCRSCFFVLLDTDFILSTAAAGDRIFTNPNFCCGYGDLGLAKRGYDCVQIPGLEKKTGTLLKGSRLCGRNHKLASTMELKGAAQPEKTLCTSKEPFQVNFLTDSFEFESENAVGNIKGGLKLTYIMDGVGC